MRHLACVMDLILYSFRSCINMCTFLCTSSQGCLNWRNVSKYIYSAEQNEIIHNSMRLMLFLTTIQGFWSKESAFAPISTTIWLLLDGASASRQTPYIFCWNLIGLRVSQRFYCFCLGSYLFAALLPSPFQTFSPHLLVTPELLSLFFSFFLSCGCKLPIVHWEFYCRLSLIVLGSQSRAGVEQMKRSAREGNWKRLHAVVENWQLPIQFLFQSWTHS